MPLPRIQRDELSRMDLGYRRTNVLDGQTLLEMSPLFSKYAERRGEQPLHLPHASKCDPADCRV